MLEKITSLEQYLETFGRLLGRQAERSLAPLHVPGRDAPAAMDLLRRPFEAQAHVIEATAKALKRQKAVMVVAECGTGKTIVSVASVHRHANGRPYRALVFCPGHLCPKWERELRETLPNITVRQLPDWHDVLALDPAGKPAGPEWYVIGRDRAKLGSGWRAAFGRRERCGYLRCPGCGERLVDKDGAALDEAALGRKRQRCAWVLAPAREREAERHGRQDTLVRRQGCGAPLWQMTGEPWRYAPADFISRKLRGYFGYLVIDECFPGNTDVATPSGSKKIKDIQPGDTVLSFYAGEVVVRRVARAIKKRLRGELVKVTHTAGAFTCTPNHKIYVTGNWIPASDLRPGNSLTLGVPNAYHHQAVPDLRGSLPVLAEAGARGANLQSELWRQAARAGSESAPPPCRPLHDHLPGVRKDRDGRGAVQGSPVLWFAVCPEGELEIAGLSREAAVPDEAEERTPAPHLVCAAEADEQGSRVQGEIGGGDARPELFGGPRRQWQLHAAAGETPRRTRVADGASCRHGEKELASRPGRSGQRVAEDCRRVRRSLAPNQAAEGQGPDQARNASVDGVDGSPFLERADRQPVRLGAADGWACGESQVIRVEPAAVPDEYVYDLEVEDTHCYFADGVLVSNCHQEAGANTAQANAAGSLASACGKVIALTGTLLNGYASSLRPLLFRLAPGSLVQEGLGWSDATRFDERYGRIETKIVERGKGGLGADNKQSRGGTDRTKSKRTVPGVLPTLFGRHLVDKAVFLSLAEVASGLPELREECVPVEMDATLGKEYRALENDLRSRIAQMLVRGDKRLLGPMLQALLAYPDYPYGWADVGWWEHGAFVPVAYPRNLNPDHVRPKEQALLDLCRAEKAQGRQVWVYVEYTDRHDVQGRLEKVLAGAGLKVGVLRAKVSPAKREEWIRKHAPRCDVLVSHPKLVETGLDLFDKGGSYNAATIVFYETGYGLFTIRQASRRSWRIGQRLPCKVVYLYYQGTMQGRALALMGKKLAAATAIEGQFAAEGLAALAEDDGGSMEMALARSLAERIDEGDARRAWGKVVVPPAPIPAPDPAYTDGAAVCRLMRAHRVTIADLARGLGITEQAVRKLRADGTRDRAVLAALAGPGAADGRKAERRARPAAKGPRGPAAKGRGRMR